MIVLNFCTSYDGTWIVTQVDYLLRYKHKTRYYSGYRGDF